MEITLINCEPVLKPQGIDLWNGIGMELFNQKLSELIPNWESWNYGIDNGDKMIIAVPDGINIPDLSSIGEVVTDDNAIW
jgi:hypothetical protein